ncbi:hypothetical protein B7486_19910 [cyanobacterium TDX16]|nr:hypothetical protein B7486_19910 [cyanobacterium TDX16]
MKRIVIAAAWVCLSNSALAAEPFSDLSFDAACKKAKEDEKVVFVDFYTTWCAPCKMLDKTTWKDKDVQAWLNKKAIALKIDAEKEVELAKRYKVTSYPTLVFLKPNGDEIDRLVGYMPAEGFLEEAKGALSGKDSVTRAKEKLESGDENDPMQRMDYAQALVQKGKHKEALKEFLWCFDHGLEHRQAFAGVRLSFLLSDIHRLGASYPPALEALQERRDAAEKILLGKGKAKRAQFRGSGAFGSRQFTAAMEVAALNRELGESARTIGVYRKLTTGKKQDPHTLSVILREIIDELMDEKEYALVMAGVPDPINAFEQQVASYESIRTYEKSRKRDGMPSSLGHFKNKAIATGTHYFQALIGIDEPARAKKMAKRVLKFDGSGETYVKLIEAALLADGSKHALWLVAEAKKNLTGDDLAEVADAARKIPTPDL